jgi:hypothetical protein
MSASANFFSNLKKDKNIVFSNKPTIYVNRKVVTVADARATVLKNLNTNKLVFEGKSKDKVLPNYKLMGDTFQFTIKYGIRPLKEVLGGSTYVKGLSKAQMLEAFDGACELLKSGDCDAALQELISANAAARNKDGEKKAKTAKKAKVNA